jgi:hypothetical protein
MVVVCVVGSVMGGVIGVGSTSTGVLEERYEQTEMGSSVGLGV